MNKRVRGMDDTGIEELESGIQRSGISRERDKEDCSYDKIQMYIYKQKWHGHQRSLVN